MSEFIAWRGKYTIPRTSREWQIAMESDYYVGPKSHAEFLKDDAVYETLSRKLVDVLGSELAEKEDD